MCYVFCQCKCCVNNNNNNKQVSIPLRQIIILKKWLYQGGSKNKSVDRINISLGLVDTNKDKKHAKHQDSKCTNIYEVCSKSIRPFSLSPIRYEQTARAKRGCTHTHSRVIVKRFRPIRHSYLSV